MPLPPKPTAVLWSLASRAGQLVTKAELLDAAWRDTAVTEAVLTGSIRTLREALGDEPTRPRYVETVHRRGYRFVEPVHVEAGAGQQMLSTAPVATAAPPPSPAVETPAAEPYACVGRDAELGRLRRAFEVARQGHRQTVFVAGEPGMGKTVLIDAFVAELRRGPPVRVGRGQCVEQYGGGEPYLPLLEVLGGLGAGPDGAAVGVGLRQHAPSWLAQLSALLPWGERDALRHQVEGLSRPRMLRELADLADALATACPLVWVLEDLHWSDPSTVEALAIIARRRGSAPLLVIGSYRPVELILRQHPLKAAKEELRSHGQCAEIVLGPLSDAAVADYLTERAPGTLAPPDVTAFVQQRTQGHPLFMATLADYLAAEGLLAGPATPARGHRLAAMVAEVPEEVQAFIEAQMERLTPRERAILETAGAVGVRFRADIVAAALGSEATDIEMVCDTLTERGQFLQDSGVTEWPDGTRSSEYQFRHALYHVALYRRLGSGRLARLHRAIGLQLERAWGDRASEMAAELAFHFERGRDVERAVGYRRQAATNALQRWAYPEALDHVARGLHLIGTGGSHLDQRAQERELQILRGSALIATQGPASPDVGQAYDRARELCEPGEDGSELFTVLRGQWYSRFNRGQLRAARDLGMELLGQAQLRNDAGLLVEAHRALASTSAFLGEPRAARTHAEQGLAFYRPREHQALAWRHGQDPGVACLDYAAFALWHLGYADQALVRVRQAVALARELAQAHAEAMARYTLAVVHQLRREAATADWEAEAVVQLSTDLGFPLYKAWGREVHGWALVVQGRAEEGIREMEQGLQETETIGVELDHPYLLARLAEAYASLGQLESGLRVLRTALEVAERNEERVWEVEIHRLQGNLVLLEAGIAGVPAQASPRSRVTPVSSRSPRTPPASRPGGRGGSEVREAEAQAEACFRRALDVAQAQGARALELRAVTSLAYLWYRQGRRNEARDLLGPVYAGFTEGFDTADLREARAMLEFMA